MGTPAPGPPPRTAPAPPSASPMRTWRPSRPTNPTSCATGGGSVTSPGSGGSTHATHWPTSSGPWPTRWPGSPDLANFFRIGHPMYLRDHTTNRRKQDMRMLSRPLAPRGQEAAAFTDGRPGGVAKPAIRPGAVGSPKTTAAPRGRTASVADQPAGELPAPVGPEDGAAVPAEDAAMDEAAETGPPPAAPEGAAVVVTRHREHRFPGRRRPVQVRFGEEEFAEAHLH